MPLFQNTSNKGAVILSKDGDRIVAYALTGAAVRRLRDSGVRHGRQVPSRVLASLIRTGGAHSPRPADAAGQLTVFEDDTANQLPRCEITGATTDLHLVVYGEGTGVLVKLLSPDARFVLQKATNLSIPVAALSLDTLDLLEITGKAPSGSAACATLRQWFRQDLEEGWRRMAKELSRIQPTLEFGPSEDELPLT